MLNIVRIILATVALAPSLSRADLTEGGKYTDITSANHPLAKSLVAVNQIGNDDSHHGNGFFWGPNGCYVVTNFHVAFAKAIVDGKIQWLYPSRREFVQNAKSHRVNIRADLDPQTGQFRRNLEGRVIRYGNFDRTAKGGNAGYDVVIMRLYEAGSYRPVCLGQEFVPQASRDHAVLAEGLLTDLNVIHLFKTGPNAARVFVNSKPCESAPLLVPGGTAAFCELRSGASGSILFQTDKNSLVTVVGLSANYNASYNVMAAANVGALKWNLKVALQDERNSPQSLD